MLESPRKISFHVIIGKHFGNNAAILLGILNFMQYHFKNKDQLDSGFFYATQGDLEEYTNLKKQQQINAVKILSDANFITRKLKGMPRKTYYRVNENVVIDWLKQAGSPINSTVVKKPAISSQETSEQVVKKPALKNKVTNINIISNEKNKDISPPASAEQTQLLISDDLQKPKPPKQTKKEKEKKVYDVLLTELKKCNRENPEKYSKEVLKEFLEYWWVFRDDITGTPRRMKERHWSTKGRLATWIRNREKFGVNSNLNKKPDRL